MCRRKVSRTAWPIQQLLCIRPTWAKSAFGMALFIGTIGIIFLYDYFEIRGRGKQYILDPDRSLSRTQAPFEPASGRGKEYIFHPNSSLARTRPLFEPASGRGKQYIFHPNSSLAKTRPLLEPAGGRGKQYIFYPGSSLARTWPSFVPPPLSDGPIMRRNLINKSQHCLRDSPFAPVSSTFPILNSSNYELPSDIEQHYFDLLNYTSPMRMIKVSSYAGYHGPWLENMFISTFCCDKPLSFFGGLVPLFVQWTDLSHIAQDYNSVPTWYATKYAKTFFSMLRKDVIYLAVVQHAGGIFLNPMHVRPNNHWNILVLSGGGNGHVPIPLFLAEQPFNSSLATTPRRNVFAFAGTIKSIYNVRNEMVKTLRELWLSKRKSGLEFHYQIYSGPKWKQVMENASLNLAPRGFGRTSFRLVECIQMGLIPVYLYDDDEWTPYRGSPAHVSNLGYSMNISDFENFVNQTVLGLQRDPNYLKIPERTTKMKQFRESHYTLKGLMEQIQYFLQDDPRCDLACQRHPSPTIKPKPTK